MNVPINRYWRAFRARANGKIFSLATVFIAAGIGLITLDHQNPLPLPSPGDGLVVVAEDGTPLRAYPTGDGVWRYRVTPEQVSPYYLEALIGYEDQYFYVHPGINPVALMRAGWQWLRYGRIVSGGSTLTMQVARILDGPAPRSLGAKLTQMARALQLEVHFSKREILTLYLNHAPMGGIVEGVEMASRAYLGKSARDLSPAEAALLAALPQAPSRYRPDLQPKRAEAVRNKVLDRMAQQGRWSAEQVADAKIEKVVAQTLRGEWLAALAAERLRRAAQPQLRAASVTGKGGASGGNPPQSPRQSRVLATSAVKAAPVAVLRTTLDAELQARVEALLADRARALPPKVSLAALVMENDSLSIRAYVGSADFSDNERFAHVDMTQGIRSPGSTLKPFLYALALDEGLIHSESLLVDAPQSFGGYAPGNFQASFSGPVSVSEALQRSLNVPAVDLLDRLGPVRFASTLRAGGVRLKMEEAATPNLSLILGGAGTTLEELVGAYRALAAGGMAGRPRLTPDAPRVEARLMSAGAAWMVREILEVGGRPERPFEEGGSRGGFAWKTGTSFGFRDAWALGVTDRYTVGIWIGRPDGTPNPGFFGANSAAPLARDIAAVLPPAATLRAPRPAEVMPVSVCWPLGLAKASTPEGMCHRTRTAWVLNQGVPPTLSDRGRPGSLRETVLVDAKSGLRVTAACSSQGMTVVTQEVARWPAHLTPWLSGDQMPQLPPWRAGCAPPSAREAGLVLRGIDEGSVVRAPNGGRPGQPRVATLSLRVSGASGKVFWLQDGVLAATQPAGEAFRLVVARDGHYAVTAMDEQGRYARVAFDAKGFYSNSHEKR